MHRDVVRELALTAAQKRAGPNQKARTTRAFCPLRDRAGLLDGHDREPARLMSCYSPTGAPTLRHATFSTPGSPSATSRIGRTLHDNHDLAVIANSRWLHRIWRRCRRRQRAAAGPAGRANEFDEIAATLGVPHIPGIFRGRSPTCGRANTVGEWCLVSASEMRLVASGSTQGWSGASWRTMGVPAMTSRSTPPKLLNLLALLGTLGRSASVSAAQRWLAHTLARTPRKWFS